MNMVMEAQGVEPQYVGGLRVTDSGERWSPKLTLSPSPSLSLSLSLSLSVSRCLSAKCARTWRNCTQASITANLRPYISTTYLTLALRNAISSSTIVVVAVLGVARQVSSPPPAATL
eukprot:COSAG05_NODE_4665_length_1419_cov_1.667424_1_plen_117_part_00